MLLTRPYYDMREEPPNLTAAKDPNAKMEKKSVTKLSLSDYKNKQKKVSDSPPDSGTTPKPDTSRRKEEVADGRMDRESKKTDAYRIREAEASKDVKAHRHHEVAHDERYACGYSIFLRHNYAPRADHLLTVGRAGSRQGPGSPKKAMIPQRRESGSWTPRTSRDPRSEPDPKPAPRWTNDRERPETIPQEGKRCIHRRIGYPRRMASLARPPRHYPTDDRL